MCYSKITITCVGGGGCGLTLSHLYYFLKLAEIQHYSKAAEQLHISQSNLSYSMDVLEKELGVKLFEKKGRNIVLSRCGSEFLAYAQRALGELEEGSKRARELHNVGMRHIRIMTSRAYYISTLISRFQNMEHNREITFFINQNHTDKIIGELKARKAHFGFCSMMENEPDIVFVPVLEQELFLLVHEEHALASRRDVEIGEVVRLPLFLSKNPPEMRRAILNIFAGLGADPLVIGETESNNAAATLVNDNLGIALLPYFGSLDCYANVKALPIRNPSFHLYIYLAYMRDSVFSQVQKDFRDFIKGNSIARNHL